MGNDAGRRDTLSSGKRGFRAMQKAAQEQAKQPKAKKSDSVQIKQSISKNCPKKANPDIFWLGL